MLLFFVSSKVDDSPFMLECAGMRMFQDSVNGFGSQEWQGGVELWQRNDKAAVVQIDRYLLHLHSLIE